MASRQGRRSSAETRALILAAAHKLFYWRGIHGTGVDRVAAEAGVAPMTLYRLFASKDDLVAAYVDHNAEPYREWFLHATRPDLGSPRERIMGLFDALAHQVDPAHCRGCPFLMTLAEFPDAEHPARIRAVATKAWVREQFGILTDALAAADADPAALADQLVIVMEGVYASVQALGNEGPARQARAIVTTLIDAAGDHNR